MFPNGQNKIAREQTYGETVTWSGTPPSGAASHKYTWQRSGSNVTVTILLSYASAGTSNNTVTIPLPADCPTPADPSNYTGNNLNIYPAIGGISTSQNVLPVPTRAALGKNSSGEWVISATTATSTAATTATVTFTYRKA